MPIRMIVFHPWWSYIVGPSHLHDKFLVQFQFFIRFVFVISLEAIYFKKQERNEWKKIDLLWTQVCFIIITTPHNSPIYPHNLQFPAHSRQLHDLHHPIYPRTNNDDDKKIQAKQKRNKIQSKKATSLDTRKIWRDVDCDCTHWVLLTLHSVVRSIATISSRAPSADWPCSGPCCRKRRPVWGPT